MQCGMSNGNCIIALMLSLTLLQALHAQCTEIKYSKPAEKAVSDEEHVFRIDSFQGNALYAITGMQDTGRASDLCIALFTEKEGNLIALIRTNQRGEFAFYGQPPGRYRMVATSKAMTELNILVELKGKPEPDIEKQQRLLLHMRLKANRSTVSYATLLSVKEYKQREKL